MQRDFSESLLRNGIVEAKSGSIELARNYLRRAVDTSRDPDILAEAWYWLSKVLDDLNEKREALENCLSFDFNNTRARRELAVLKGELDEKEIINPDAPPALSPDSVQPNVDRFMCPQCGGRMIYAPNGKTLVCEFCTLDQNLTSENEAEEQDFVIAMATTRGHSKPVAMQVFHCEGCGAEFILPPDMISASCAYCDSPHVVSLEESRDLLQPEGVIPHAFNQKQATKLLVKWVETNQIKPQKKVNLPSGLYMPIWTFDIGGGIGYRGDRYEVESNFGQRAKRVVQVEDTYPVHIDDLPVPASQKIAGQLLRILPTFDLSQIQTYDPGFLASWAAEVYDVPMSDASLDARSRAYNKLIRKLPGSITSLYNLKTSSANLAIDSFKLVLLPLWITEIITNGKEMLVLINGQNGVVQSDLVAKEKKGNYKNGLFDWLEDLLDD